MDVVLVSGFADPAALQAYQNHPHHKAIASQLASLRLDRVVLDYPSQAPGLADVDLAQDLSFAPTAPGSL